MLFEKFEAKKDVQDEKLYFIQSFDAMPKIEPVSDTDKSSGPLTRNNRLITRTVTPLWEIRSFIGSNSTLYSIVPQLMGKASQQAGGTFSHNILQNSKPFP